MSKKTRDEYVGIVKKSLSYDESFHSGDSAADLFYVTPSGAFLTDFDLGCHASLPRAWTRPAFGQILKYKVPGYEDEQVQKFLEWLVDPEESIYSSFIKELGKDFHVIREPENNHIFAWVLTRSGVNKYVLFNFFKSVRFLSEHPSFFKFWYKWAVEKGKNPRLAFMLGAFWDKNGQSHSTGHGPIEASVVACDLRRVLYVDHKQWNLRSSPASESKDYYGEQKATWVNGGEEFLFDLHKDIPVISKKEVPTRFWTKVYGAGRVGNGMTDETFENFFDNAEKIYKEKVGAV